MSQACIDEIYEYTGITNTDILPEPVSFEQCAKNSGAIAICRHKQHGRYMILVPKNSRDKVRRETGKFLEKISNDPNHVPSNACRSKFGHPPSIADGGTVTGFAAQIGQKLLNSLQLTINEEDPPTQVITTVNNTMTVNPFQNPSYLKATLALPSTPAVHQATDQDVNTFSTRSDEMSKITMDDIKTQIHSAVETRVSESLSAVTTELQKYVVDSNAKVQLEMNRMQLETQKSIAESQARSEERIMKNHREEMRSMLATLTNVLQATQSGNPPNVVFETLPQNVSGVNDSSSSQNLTKKSSTVNTKSTNSCTSSL